MDKFSAWEEVMNNMNNLYTNAEGKCTFLNVSRRDYYMNEWYKTSIEPAPDNVEVLLSDGKLPYIGTYDKNTDYFFDQNRFTLKTPRYWHPLPEPPKDEA